MRACIPKMVPRFVLLGIVVLATGVACSAVELVGYSVLPADTFAIGPTSGQFIEATNGRKPPFVSQQPVQGFSSVIPADRGRYWALADNGFGGKANSADYVLGFYLVRPEFRTEEGGSGRLNVESFLPLHDPDRLIPFRIVADMVTYPNGDGDVPVDPVIRRKRLLTGADFDVESFCRMPDGTFYIGEEFGPFLLHVDAEGRLVGAPVPLPGVKSPDNPRPTGEANLARSKGFEGMGLSLDGKVLYPMLEGPVEQEEFLRIYEFDVKRRTYRQAFHRYRMEEGGEAIGELTMVSNHEALVIERDNGQAADAKFKRVYRIDLRKTGADGFLLKQQVVDLMAIPDPKDIGGMGTGTFTFPFWTIESVLMIDDNVMGIANDNNYPFSVGRHVESGQPDDIEFILIDIGR